MLHSLVPVIAIGVFDRNINDEVLVKVPELYKYGSGGHLFGLWRFSVYMFDGIYQVRAAFRAVALDRR